MKVYFVCVVLFVHFLEDQRNKRSIVAAYIDIPFREHFFSRYVRDATVKLFLP